MKQRNGRMMVLAGVALCDLAVGSVTIALASGGAPTDLAVSSPGSAAAGVTGGSSLSVVAEAVAGVLAQATATPTPPPADADAVVTAAEGAPPVTVAPPAADTTEATEPPAPTTTPAPVAVGTVAAAPVEAPATSPAPAPVDPGVADDTASVAAAPAAPAPPPAGTPSGSTVEDAIYAWFPDVYDQAVRVARCESSLNPGAVSRGGGNHGLFQINRVHRGSFEAVTGQPWSMVYDPSYNAQFARHLYDASGWGPWGCQP